MFPEQTGIPSPLHSFHLATVYIVLPVTSNEELPSLGCGLPHRQQIVDSIHEQKNIQVKISIAIPSMSQIKKNKHFMFKLYIHITVHRDKFSYNKTN